jgi:hypothetical protein
MGHHVRYYRENTKILMFKKLKQQIETVKCCDDEAGITSSLL